MKGKMYYTDKFRSLYLQFAGKLTQTSDYAKIVSLQLTKILPESGNVYEFNHNGSKVLMVFC